MKQTYGFNWRNHVRGLTTSLDAGDNLAFTRRMRDALVELNTKLAGRLDPRFTLDPSRVDAQVEMPHVAVVAADANGRIVRYYENTATAAYFGSPIARDSETGFYERAREPRMIASVGKMIAAIGIANQGKDNSSSLYLDPHAPKKGLETCRHGTGNLRRGRSAEVSFACSLNEPLLLRTARLGQSRVQDLIDRFGFNMPPKDADGEGTPASTAAVMGLISGSPRRVHQMSSVILNAMIGRDGVKVTPPTLIQRYDTAEDEKKEGLSVNEVASMIIPRSVIRRGGTRVLKALLEAPLCYKANTTSHGTLKSLSKWCATRRSDVRLHFAKTGTQVTLDPDATVDAWTAGGLQFANGAAYSYVVVVGTGSASSPWARSVHASQAAAPLLAELLAELKEDAKANPRPDLLPRVPQAIRTAPQRTGSKTSGWRALPEDERDAAFGFN